MTLSLCNKNKYNFVRKIIHGILIGVIALILIIAINLFANKDKAIASQDVARPSTSGFVHQDGMKTLDEKGNEVWLRGVSTHGLTFAPEFVNENLFSQLSNDWSANLIRLAMYSEEYCFKNKQKSLRLLHNGIEYAINNDMYVIVDWHILRDSNPNSNIEQALDFFENISAEYPDCPNIIYEICNEPNGDTSWADIVNYSNQVIPVIRKNSPKSMILVGTPDNCRDLEVAVESPIKNFENLMYVFHYYAASHHEGMRSILKKALDNKLPVFISEFGISEETGDGLTSYKEAAEWMDIVNEYKLNFAMWSFSNINETSAIFKNYANFPDSIDDKNLSSSGYWIKNVLQNKDPHSLVNPDQNTLEYIYSLKTKAYTMWWVYAVSAAVITFIILMFLILRGKRDNKKSGTYYDIVKKKISVTKFKKQQNSNDKNIELLGKLLIILCVFFFLVYLQWRIWCSMPLRYGWIAILFNILLLIVEIIGFWESVLMGINLLKSYKNKLPVCAADVYPDVDVFIATYNEPKDLLIKTINGCVNMKYPKKEKVHIYLCDDTSRKEIKQLAKQMHINYLDRESNEGAKAGNLNNALTKTNSPYVVTFDADMIPKSDFLLKTIPYFVDSEILNKDCSDNNKVELGFIQTPQSFYQPDVFQHNFYLEKKLNNEQDFFYRIIECAKTSTNCVVYGGSNTVLSRKALEAVGGFYTKSVTEDFATGMLIQAAGFVSLGLPEPLAYGQTPNTFEDHKKQRIRWARGVISTRKNLKKDVNKEFTYFQKLNYWCCSSYWYFPLKNLVYFLLPMLYSVFGLIVIQCSIYDLLLFWIPQLLLQILSLKVISKNKYSFTINTIGEVALTPFLLIPVLKELFGFQMQKFQVTDKSVTNKQEKKSFLWTIPFIVFIVFSIYCIWDSVSIFMFYGYVALIALIFWLLLNAYYVVAAMILISCKRKTIDSTIVHDKISGSIKLDNNIVIEALYFEFQDKKVFAKLDGASNIKIGQEAVLSIPNKDKNIALNCQVEKIVGSGSICFKIKDELISTSDYLQFLYDRTPSLPNSIRYINSVYLVVHSIISRFGNKKN